jgi:hypothetical protein
VPVLHPPLAREAGQRDQSIAGVRAVDRLIAVGRKTRRRRGDRLAAFLRLARRERVGMFGERAQPQLAVGGGVAGVQPPYAEVR